MCTVCGCSDTQEISYAAPGAAAPRRTTAAMRTPTTTRIRTTTITCMSTITTMCTMVLPACRLILVSKIDLLPHVRFNVDRCVAHASEVNPDIEVRLVSAEIGEGMQAWYEWLRREHPRRPTRVPA